MLRQALSLILIQSPLNYQAFCDRVRGDHSSIQTAEHTGCAASQFTDEEVGLYQALYPYLSLTRQSAGGAVLAFTGLNLHIRNGDPSNQTNSLNGLGNLILGYHENLPDPTVPVGRTGSHNLILGVSNQYTSFGGIISGRSNLISAPYSSVLAGERNIAGGQHSAVITGIDCRATGFWAAVLGGQENQAIGNVSTVGGGTYNQAIGTSSSCSAGYDGRALGVYSTVSGGSNRTAAGDYNWVAGLLSSPSLPGRRPPPQP